MQNDENAKRGRICEKQKTGSKYFFGALLQLKSKTSEHTPETQLYIAYFQKHSDQKDDLVIFGELFRQADIICFWTTCHNF